MDNNKIGFMALVFIRTYFEGGTESFSDEGGLVSFVPFDSDSILIYHPDMPEYFVQAIENHNSKSDAKFIIVPDLNFAGIDPMDSIKQLNDVGESVRAKFDIPMIVYNPLNPLVLMILIPEATLSREDIHAIAEIFSLNVPGVIRGCLTVGQDNYPFSSSEIFEVEKKITLEPDRAVITQDVITDIKITLSEVNSVEDFLNKF
jgi:hypothetical protein